MAYTASVSLGSPIGIGITSVKLYECSGNNSGCTALANYTNVAVSLFNPTYLITGITDSNRWLKIEPVGACSGTTQNLQVSGFPGPTSTPAPTATTPSATPAPTASTTPGPTATAGPGPTATPTPTPTPSSTTPGPTATALPGCSSVVSGEYTGSTLYNYPDRQLNFAGVPNGSIISFTCTANDRPNNISIRTDLTVLESTLWFGSTEGYVPEDYWYPTAGTGPITLTITYDNTKTYYIDTLTAPATVAPPNDESDYWEVSIQCLGLPPTPTPTATTPPLYGFYRSNPKTLSTEHCNDNQVTSALFYSTSSTIANMLGTTVYTDTEYTIWLGGGFYYAVSSDNQFNTNNPPYYVIKVDNFGEVIDVQYIANCTGGANA
jgi:hypothetical protein